MIAGNQCGHPGFELGDTSVDHIQARVADLVLARHGPAGRVLLRRMRDAEREMVRSIAVMVGRSL